MQVLTLEAISLTSRTMLNPANHRAIINARLDDATPVSQKPGKAFYQGLLVGCLLCMCCAIFAGTNSLLHSIHHCLFRDHILYLNKWSCRKMCLFLAVVLAFTCILIAAVAAFKSTQGSTRQPGTFVFCLLSHHCQAQQNIDHQMYILSLSLLSMSLLSPSLLSPSLLSLSLLNLSFLDLILLRLSVAKLKLAGADFADSLLSESEPC